MTAMTSDSKYSRATDFFIAVPATFARPAPHVVLHFASRLLSDLQHREERVLRNFHPADALHALLAFFLFLEQLPLPADVAAVTLREDVLAQRANGFACDDAAADRGLDRNLEHLK